ncbi:MAG: SLC13 family permease [Candidatus Krumholzibacteriia bacterium]
MPSPTSSERPRLLVVLLWGWVCVVFPPERTRLPGLHAQARTLQERLPPFARKEVGTLAVVLAVMGVLVARSFVPALAPVDKSAVILAAAALFFISGVLDLKDLEHLPWNIVLLFGGAMSLGFCLWETGAAEWLAIGWLGLFHGAPWLVFIMGVAAFVLVMTNFIMNVAAIAITLPVALVMAQFVGVHPEVVMFVSLAAAGMPFLLLVGAAPNAIAYESGQFRARDFFVHGIVPSLVLLLVIFLFVWKIWPAMGMPVMSGG